MLVAFIFWITFLFFIYYALFCVQNDKKTANRRKAKIAAEVKLAKSQLKKYLRNSRRKRSAAEDVKLKFADSPELTAALRKLVDFVIRDYIEWWYTPISQSDRFPNDLRHLMEYALGQLVSGSKLLEGEIVFEGLLTEVRKLLKCYRFTEIALEKQIHRFKKMKPHERQGLILNDIDKNYEFHVATGAGMQEKYLREITSIILESILKPSDCACKPLFVLLREILACKVLDPLMGYASSYYINSAIISACNKAVTEADIKDENPLGPRFDKPKSTPLPSTKVTMSAPVGKTSLLAKSTPSTNIFRPIATLDLSEDMEEDDKNCAPAPPTEEKIEDNRLSSTTTEIPRTPSELLSVGSSQKRVPKVSIRVKGTRGEMRSSSLVEYRKDSTRINPTLHAVREKVATSVDSANTNTSSIRSTSTSSLCSPRARYSRLRRISSSKDTFMLRIIRSMRAENPKPHIRYAIQCKNGKMLWVVERRYNDFHELNRGLRRDHPAKDPGNLAWAVCFPRKTLPFLTNTMGDTFIQQRADQLQTYLDFCVQDPHVVESSHFREFIIPTHSGATGSGKVIRKRIMANIYGMVDEIFELTRHGWLRKQVIWTASQLLGLFYNSSLYGKVQTTMSKMTSEEALTGAINGLLEVMWPNGTLFYTAEDYKPYVPPTSFELWQTRDEAFEVLLRSIELYVPILGRDYAVQGAFKFLEFLQVDMIVQHLAFSLLDSLVTQAFPSTKERIDRLHVAMASTRKKRRHELLAEIKALRRNDEKKNQKVRGFIPGFFG